MATNELHRYEKINVVQSPLDPFDDVVCWVKGLTSAKYVEELLKSKHSLQGPIGVRQRSQIVAGLVQLACKYFDQAQNGPQDVSFLPLYYALLNLSKAYIAIGPYSNELSQNRKHGATYEPEKNVRTLDNDYIKLRSMGAIPLLYRTLVGEDLFENVREPLTIKMRDIYPYIPSISAEYKTATGNESRLIPFRIWIAEKQGKEMVVARITEGYEQEMDKVKIAWLQGFNGLRREDAKQPNLVSELYDKGNMQSLRSCLRPAMLYGALYIQGGSIQYVPWSRGKLLLPEELPLICAFYHMSSVVRYNPDALSKLMDSKYWPVLLALRRHGVYRFTLLFWSFVTQCCTYILPG